MVGSNYVTDENNGIGIFKNNQFTLPWKNKDDLSF